MVAYEGANPSVAYMNEAVNRDVLPHRTIEAIKTTRRRAGYIEQLRACWGQPDAVGTNPATVP